MKRFIAAMVATFMMVATFANVELDLNMYGAPLCEYNLDSDYDINVKLENPIGFDTKWGFMIGAPAPFCDIGIKFSYAYDFFWNLHQEVNFYGHDFENDCSTFGVGANMTLGPLVRFNLGDWHTIYVSPGLMGKCCIGSYDSTSIDSNGRESTDEKFFAGAGLLFDLDIGYRIWLINNVGFHFGFDLGLDMNWPLLAKAWLDGDEEDVKDGGEYRIYFGFCFNFGDKSPDKYR